jgi:hypothetical protein
MKYLYQQLDELLNTIKYSEASGNEDPDYLENDYFEDVVELCREIVEYTEEAVHADACEDSHGNGEPPRTN